MYYQRTKSAGVASVRSAVSRAVDLGRSDEEDARLGHRLHDVEPLRVVIAGQPAHGDVLGVGEQQLLEAGRRLEREVDVLRAVVLGLRVG